MKRTPIKRSRKPMKRSAFKKKAYSARFKTATEKETYELWRLLTYERDDHTCQYCGRQEGDKARGKIGRVVIQPHHIFEWSYKHMRFMLENSITLCSRCHRYIAHGKTEEFREFLKDKWIGRDRYNALRLISKISPLKTGKYDPGMELVKLKVIQEEGR